jgi:hypothetical protein
VTSTGDRSPAAGGAIVRGQVRGLDGRPVEGARVAITASPVPVPEIAAVTDAEGRFSLFAPAPGAYTFTAHADGPGGPATGSVQVPPSPGAADRPDSMAGDALAAAAGDALDADMSSDDPLLEAAPVAPAPEVRVVLTFSSSQP